MYGEHAQQPKTSGVKLPIGAVENLAIEEASPTTTTTHGILISHPCSKLRFSKCLASLFHYFPITLELSVKSPSLHPVFGPVFTPYPLFQWYLQNKEICL